MTGLILIYCFVALMGHGGCQNLYCKLPCGNYLHTICEFSPCEADPKKCGSKSTPLLLTDEERKQVTFLHNTERDAVSTPPNYARLMNSADMNVIRYDKELEFIAQCHANNCNYYGEHDYCRRTTDEEIVGQNTFTTRKPNPNLNKGEILQMAIQTWIKEAKSIVLENVVNLEISKSASVIHGVQILWAKTKHIGCGRTKFSDSAGIYYIFVCNYAPGIVDQEKIYTPGDCCMNCTCDKEFKTLCYVSPVSKKFNPWDILSNKENPNLSEVMTNNFKNSIFVLVLIQRFLIYLVQYRFNVVYLTAVPCVIENGVWKIYTWKVYT